MIVDAAEALRERGPFIPLLTVPSTLAVSTNTLLLLVLLRPPGKSVDAR